MVFTILYPEVTLGNHSLAPIEISAPDRVVEICQLNPGGSATDPWGQEWGVEEKPAKGYLLFPFS